MEEEEDKKQRRVKQTIRSGGESCGQHLTPDKGKKRKRQMLFVNIVYK